MSEYNEKNKNIYISGEYFDKHPAWHTEDSLWKADNILNILYRNNLQRIRTVCEIGCGAGEILVNMQKSMDKETRFIGYDISPQAVNLCKTKENDHLCFKLQDFLHEKEHYSDLILLIDVLEHIEDYFELLRHVKSSAKYVIINFPLDFTMEFLLKPAALLKYRRKVGHIHYFTKEIALQILSELGYKVIDYSVTSGVLRGGKPIEFQLVCYKPQKRYSSKLIRISAQKFSAVFHCWFYLKPVLILN